MMNAQFTHKRAILCNDDPVQREWLADAIRKLGLDVSTYEDGAEGLRALRGSPPPDLIVVDLHMPRVDGWRFCRAIRSPDFRAFNKTPVLITSATFSGVDVEEITVELGANAFLAVPFKSADLEKCVDDLLAGRTSRAALTYLLVDPTPDTRVRTALRLKEEGYRVVTQERGAEALGRFAEGGIDVVLVSDEIPDMPVSDVVRQIKERKPRTSVIVLTASQEPSAAVDMLCDGADGTLEKSALQDRLLDLVHTTLRERSILGIREILEDRTRELVSSEARYRTLFQVMPEPMVLLDREHRVLQANPTALRLFGSAAGDLIDRDFLSLVPAEGRGAVRESLRTMRAGETDRFETRIQPLAGMPVEVEISGNLVDLNSRRALLLSVRDLTETRRAENDRRKMEAHLQHVQRLESLGVFAGGIAHDFNNLLAGIMGYSSLLRMDLPAGGEPAEILEQIELSARRASELAEQILAYSGRSRIQLAPTDLSAMVNEMATLIGPAISKKADLEYDLGSDLPLLMADSGLLRQVVMNLIINASDSLQGASGRITVRTGSAWNTQGLFENALSQDPLEAEQYQFIEIGDTGCGMPKETMDRIFDPFFSTKDTGRGLGLAATLGIVWQHQGAVEVQSVVGQGTTFRVWVPMDVEPAVPEAPPSPPLEEIQLDGSGLVLVAEDEAELRTMVVRAMKHFGFEVVEAKDGREAVAIFEARHAELRAVLLDLSMPELDGGEALKLMREIDADVPVIMSSGYRQLDLDPEAGLPDRLLWKPYSVAQLAECLDGILRELVGVGTSA